MATTLKTKKIVALLRYLPDPWLKELYKDSRVIIRCNNNKEPIDEEKTKKLVKGATVVVSVLDPVTRNVMEEAGEMLGLIANFSAGFDHIDIKEANERGIAVTNTPEVSSTAVAEFTISLILSVAKRIAEADQFARDGRYKFWDPCLMVGLPLAGKTLGIIGSGNIGSSVARSCYHGLGMKILYYDLKKNDDLERSTHAYQVSLNNLLKNADVISVHCPLTLSTRHMLKASHFKLMKKTAIFINTARGAIVKEKDLVNALRKKIVFGAGIDVYEFEPKISAQLKQFNNVIITPHCASATEETRAKMGEAVYANIQAFLSGKIPPNLVNMEIKNKIGEGL